MSKLSDKILKQVKDKGLKRIPKWRFILDHAATWFILTVAIIVSSLSVAMIIHQVYMVEWDVVGRMPKGGFGMYFKVVPYLWIAVSAVLFYFVYLEFKKTKTGHRYGAEMVIGSTIGISILFGVVFFITKGAGQLHERLEERIPFYKYLHSDSEEMWKNAESGFLGGEIMEKEEHIFIKDSAGNLWEIEFEDEEKGRNLLGKNGRIKILGEKLGEHNFKALEIRPWQKPVPFWGE